MSSKRKCNCQSLDKKLAALREVEKGRKKKDIANEFGIPQNTLSTWIKNKHKIIEYEGMAIYLYVVHVSNSDAAVLLVDTSCHTNAKS